MAHGDKYRLIRAGRINNIEVTSGDILRENATNKTVKVRNAYADIEGNILLAVEYNAPSENSAPFQLPITAFSFIF